MITWEDDLLRGLSTARNVGDILELMGRSAQALGFERCAYGYRSSLPFTNARTTLISTYPEQWRQRYVDAGYLHVDPTALHGRRSNLPLVWSDDLVRHAPQMWEEARSFGLSVGWAQSCFERSGAVGMFSVSRSHEPLTPTEIRAKEGQLRGLVSIAHTALSAALVASDASLTDGKLTGREVEILQWTADGKTSEQAAAILGISVNTVNFHIKNAIAKLRVANKTAAVARAARLGLLDI